MSVLKLKQISILHHFWKFFLVNFCIIKKFWIL